MSYSISYKSKDTEKSKSKINNLVNNLATSILKTIKHFFPHFKQELQKIEDYRKKNEYVISEILFGAIALFLFKQGLRNSFKNNRNDKDFTSNYEKLFGMRLPHQDTTNDLFRMLALEEFKTSMIRELIEKKVLHTSTKVSNRQWQLQGKYFWMELLAFLKYGSVDGEYLKQLLEKKVQIRLE